jgi:hypothetical protein
VAALGILQRFDPPQAISMLEAMMRRADAPQLEEILACLLGFEFPLVRGLLEKLLMTTTSEHIWSLGLCLYQANPFPENLFSLYSLEKKLPNMLAQKVRNVRLHNTLILREWGRLPPGAENELEAKQEAELQEQQRRRKSPYAVQATTAAPWYGALLEKWQDFLGDSLSGERSPILRYAVVFLVLIALVEGVWLYSSMGGGTGRSTSTPSSGAVSAEAVWVVGAVFRIEEHPAPAVILETTTHGYVYLDKKPGMANLRLGDRVRAHIVPYRRRPDGVLVARLTSFGPQ